MERKVMNFNIDWLYIPENTSDGDKVYCDESGFEKISLPHTNKILPHHYFNEDDYRFVSWYRKHFRIDKKYEGKKIYVHFEGVMTIAKVYVNGNYVGEHKGGYTPFELDITNYIKYGDNDNLIAVQVDSNKHPEIPPEGYIVDYMLFGGIYRNVFIKIVNEFHIKDVYFVVDKLDKYSAEVLISTTLQGTKINGSKILTEIINKDGEVCSSSIIDVEEIEKEIIQKIKIDNPLTWHPDHPHLYSVVVKLIVNNTVLDDYTFKTGLRTVYFGDDGKFYINGEPLKLRGLNRHQTFPYVGGAMPDRVQRKDADILKYELGLNYVRTSHYPQAVSFLERCDEIGLLVFEEIPGWQHIGDNEWKHIAKENVKEMILRDRNHPCIFMWGVRINESLDDHEFYTQTNKIAHTLDRSRPTGGVRYLRDSEKLEDVFTYNDFIYNLEGKIQLPNHSKYLVTEYLGHMYPTKSYDNLQRLINHARLHALIQDKQYGIPNMAGASGWCAFDYNTTSAFGSGDNICYHGVSDIFRLPKFAAHFYRSQADPQLYGAYVFIASYLIPSFEEENGDKLLIFSNCDSVSLYINNKFLKLLSPNRVDFPSLPHPPFEVSLKEVGIDYMDVRVNNAEISAIGIINGIEVAKHTLRPYDKPYKLILKSDDTELYADGGDCTRVTVAVVDRNDSVLPYANIPVIFEINENGELIGENPLTLEAGRGAVYVKSKRKTGKITLKAKSPYVFDESKIELNLKNVEYLFL
ncbi:glycoside hydrolase family 2 TIM barrel-domain containing protein [Thermoanaerobacterium sp. RBIITD]|uniref:glycoside hydrolase family 2 protein n=1 Tax=Thermoanaerobacterium sp. RBIITD TaxID=1550240 RepID=UPI000BB76D5C|nr:glycoside hydrolase family 2 TIM barrel-domain containing protein [Thermoanaerobacterium sp. RBIITD]SNX52721.1 beta-galactosidase [Thermoanaerobacterium sp. RBIITD]